MLIYDRPASGLEAKFSLPFCAAAAIVDGRVGIDTFEPGRLRRARDSALMSRVRMRVDPSLDGIGQPLTQARITVRLRDGRVLMRAADGARGYPERPASDAELDRQVPAVRRTDAVVRRRPRRARATSRHRTAPNLASLLQALVPGS